MGLIKDDTRILSDPAPQIAVSELADSSVNFVVRPWVKKEDYWGVKFDLTRKIKEAFDENGIEIPFPQRTVHTIQEAA
jgi:small conductance mechanosensitive channel